MAPNAPPEPIKVAEITASAFDIAQTPPMLGRYLLPSDEEAARAARRASSATTRGACASTPIRRSSGAGIQLGGTLHTIVGVMPAGFGFPIDHQFWMPLAAGSLEVPPHGRGRSSICLRG